VPLVSFCALVIATVAAFFITQHLKVTTPLLAGFPRPVPAVINPFSSGRCGTPPVSHRRMRISFYLLHRSDHVDVWIVNASGSIVATLATNRYMRRGVRNPDGVFSWDGLQDDGSIAPDGVYYIRVALLGQGRTVEITNQATGALETVTVDTRPPRPRVLAVTPHIISPVGGWRRAGGSRPAGAPPRSGSPVASGASATIRYTGTEGRGASVLVYRTDLPGQPRLVKTFGTAGTGSAVWDGLIGGRPAPPGVYLIGLRVTDAACNVGRFPARLPPPPGSTPGAGVTVRYLAAAPPLDPVTPGSRATVFVDSRHRRYRWSLARAGARRSLASGSSGSAALKVPIPPRRPGLYVLSLRSGAHSTAVPIVARSPRPARLLVVLPALTWAGLDPGDEDGDGVPDTLAVGAAIPLRRTFAGGLPAGFADLFGVLSELDSAQRPYDLTTDLGLIDGVGPGLTGHRAVLLAGSEEWITPALAGQLRAYVQKGGHVLSLGISSLLRELTVAGGRALDPTPPAAVDPFGARPGAVTGADGQLVGEIEDGLGIFRGTAGLFAGFPSYEPVTPPPDATPLSEAGVSSSQPSIVGFGLGRGIVVEIALPGFGSRLVRDASIRQLLDRVIAVLVA
jgi:hypothetical protein